MSVGCTEITDLSPFVLKKATDLFTKCLFTVSNSDGRQVQKLILSDSVLALSTI